jgi:L-fuconolactonase
VRIDSHHHLWRYNSAEYGWISDDMSALRRDFLASDLRTQLNEAKVDGSIAVQARQSLEETLWLLDLAQNSPIHGVVGWAPIAAEDFPAILDDLRQNPLLKGLRHVVQAEPPQFLARADFQRGIHHLAKTGLVYDFLVYAHQLSEGIAFIDQFPAQSFVLDHMGKPAIARLEIDRWSRDIRELARRPHVTCKVSGLVTEADPATWTPELLRPYFDVVLDSFGPERLMIGTDWPVCTIGSSYSQWWHVVEGWTASLSPFEQAAILGETATRVYRLNGASSR